MARLTKADAARQLHISRTTLYKLIDQGKLSATPEGLIDSAELVRVVSTLDIRERRPRTPLNIPAMDTNRQALGQYERPEHASIVDSERHERARQPTSIERALDMVGAQMQLMRDELQAARDERAMLLHMLQDMQHRYDRLLEAPRPVPGRETPATPVVSPPQRPPTAEEDVDRNTTRRRILALLQDYPEGLSAAEIRVLLGMKRSLTDTCTGMYRGGLLRRVSHGRYAGA